MAQRRIVITTEPTTYHVITRTSRSEFLFDGDLEKRRMREMLWKTAEFCGVEILTYAIMSNHVHIVVRVPVKEEADAVLSNAEVLRRYGELYGKAALALAQMHLRKATPEIWGRFREEYVPLMHDLSWFMRLFKQRFSRWHNCYYKTFGTLWAERFTSVVIDAKGEALLAVCAYVDLNPVRAGIAEDPREYRWSGYGEACGGNPAARRGVEKVCGADTGDWKSAQARYRMLLYAAGTVVRVKNGRRQGTVSEVAAERVRKRRGNLTLAEALRDRVGYFTRGGILGSKEFVDRLFEMNRDKFPPKRKDGARKMRGADWGRIRSLRDLRCG